MVLERRNGQFFIIGAMLIAALVTGYVVLDLGSLTAPATQTPLDLFERAMNEFPESVNHMMANSVGTNDVQRRLTSYMGFTRQAFLSHGVSPRSHALIGVPAEGNLTFLFANFRGQTADTIRLTVDGTTQTRSSLTDGSTTVFSFDTFSEQPNVRLSFRTGSLYNETFTTPSSRVSSLYYLHLAGEDQTWRDTRTY